MSAGAMKNVDPELTLYRFFDGSGRLLYIGQTISAWDRMRGHRVSSSFWPMVKRVDFENGCFANPAELAAAEVAAIKAERPVYNKMHADPAVRLEMLAETVGSDPIPGLGEDPTVDEVKIALFRGEVSLSEIGQRYPLLYINHLKGLRAAVAAGQEFTGDGDGVRSISPVPPAGLLGVEAFWVAFQDRFVWDLLPWPFLWDLYRQWLRTQGPGTSAVGRTTFIAAVVEIAQADSDGGWNASRRQCRVGDRMSRDEPIAEEYGLEKWRGSFYGQKQYRGVMRKPLR